MVWFEFLKEQRLFDPAGNPDPIQVDGGFQIPYWGSLAYLEKLADQIKEGKCVSAIPEIIKIIEDVSEHPKDNYMTWYVFMKIINRLPNDVIPESLLNFIPTWFQTKFDTMSQSSGLREELLTKFLSDNPSTDDIKKAELILHYVFLMHKEEGITGSTNNPEESFKTLLHPYTIKEICEDKNLHQNIARYCSTDVIWQLTHNLKLLLFDYPHGIVELVKSGEINYRVRVLKEDKDLRAFWKVHSSEEEEKELGSVSRYEEKSKQELYNIFDTLLKLLPNDLDPQSLSWSVYRIVLALKVDLFSSIVYHPIHELEVDGYGKLTETFAYLLRELLIALAKEKPDACKRFVEAFAYDKKFHYPFFLRMVFYLTADHYDLLQEIFWKLIGDNDPEQFFSDDMYYPDLTHLLERNGKQFTEKENATLQKIIIQGSQDHQDQQNDSYKEYWRFGWYTALKDHPSFQNAYESLSQKLKSSGESYKERNKVKIRVGYVTPFTASDLREISFKQILVHINNFQPGDRFDGPSMEGFAETLAKVVEERSAEFATEIDLFKNVPLTYINSIIHGLHNSWKNKQNFDWDPILHFFNTYVDRKNASSATNEKSDSLERIDTKLLAGSIAWLISEGCRDDKHSFENFLLPLAKNILFKIVIFVQPEERSELANVDYPTLSYNTTSGKILRAVLDYALAMARVEEKEINEKKWDDEIQFIFSNAINKNVIEGYIYLGMYYEQFYYLDQPWIVKRINDLRNIEDERWEAFLGGLAFARIPFNEEVYRWLFPHYQNAIEKEKILINRTHQGGLVLHVLAFYLRNYESLNQESLTSQVICHGSPNVVKAFCSRIRAQEKYLKQYPEQERNEIRKKIFDCWEAILNRVGQPGTEEEMELYEYLAGLAGYIEKLNVETTGLLIRTIEFNKKKRYFHSFIDDLVRLMYTGQADETAHYLSLILSKLELPVYVMDNDQKKIILLIRFLYEHQQSAIANGICNKISISGPTFLHQLYREFNSPQ